MCKSPQERGTQLYPMIMVIPGKRTAHPETIRADESMMSELENEFICCILSMGDYIYDKIQFTQKEVKQ